MADEAAEVLRKVVEPVELAAACSGKQAVNQPAPARGQRPGGLAGPAGAPVLAGIAVGSEMQRLYRSMGLLAGAGSIPFVASVSFLRSPTSDSTLTLVAMSLPSRALGFAREGDRYAASYTVRLELRQGMSVVKQIESKETVRVPTFRETSRTDESIIWQQYLRLAPGRYALAIALKATVSAARKHMQQAGTVAPMQMDLITKAKEEM